MSVKLVWDCAMRFVIVKSGQEDNVAKCDISRLDLYYPVLFALDLFFTCFDLLIFPLFS